MGASSFLLMANQRSGEPLLSDGAGGNGPVRNFGYYLYSKEFVAFTDDKHLCTLLMSDRLNCRLRCLGMKLQHTH